MYLNGYNNANPDVIPEADIGIYVQDALNELEFIMGDVSTEYGALRVSLGYPKPWKINYVEVGSSDSIANSKENKRTDKLIYHGTDWQ